MSFLNQVELSVYKPNTQRSPIARRREKLAFKLEEQLKLAIDSTYQPTKIVWNTDSDGNQHKVEQPKRIKRWWIEHTDGSVQLTVRYGSKPLEFAKGKNAIALKRKEEVEPTLRKLKLAVLGGELDEMLEQQIGAVKRSVK
ncbi:hypothetical protein PM03_06435 [Thalassobacter stenotrophicus]|uniref:DUF6641 family protein n=1 Tax=Thalassobacter stenotrophicus TaxID=266809 RepID=UPI00051F9C67|nr:DUF6641 family protein [Thalassobacter stenotrophicus]KGK80295.1 hypothetical protein PM03_06435 [Thalassobacter stenotrophicus]